MIRWILFIISMLLFAVGLLTVFKAPAHLNWQLSLLAGEYGHWLGVAAGVILIYACSRRTVAGLGLATCLAASLAVLLLFNPSVQAWWISRTLPQRMQAAFGPAQPGGAPFSFVRLFAPGPAPVAVETLTYAPGLGLDFYRARGRARAACVVVVHSGGWDNGVRSELPSFDRWLAGQGYAVAAISYRLAPRDRWPAQRDDIVAAVAFLRSQAEALGLDPERMVLFGRSAGGQLVEATAYGVPALRLRGVIALYGPADLNFAYAFGQEDDILKSPLLLRQFLGGAPGQAPAAYDSASAILHVTPASPPTLLMHGRLDPLVWHRQSERLAARLTAERVPHVFISLPWATHAFEYNLQGPGGQLTTYAVGGFLAAVTK